MTLKFHYDEANEDPPAPFVSVQVRHAARPERTLNLRAKVDTGADISAVPESAALALQLREAGRLQAIGFDGRVQQVVVYAAQIDLPAGESVQLNVLPIPADYALIGRDALNLLRLLLDGPPSPWKSSRLPQHNIPIPHALT